VCCGGKIVVSEDFFQMFDNSNTLVYLRLEIAKIKSTNKFIYDTVKYKGIKI